MRARLPFSTLDLADAVRILPWGTPIRVSHTLRGGDAVPPVRVVSGPLSPRAAALQLADVARAGESVRVHCLIGEDPRTADVLLPDVDGLPVRLSQADVRDCADWLADVSEDPEDSAEFLRPLVRTDPYRVARLARDRADGGLRSLLSLPEDSLSARGTGAGGGGACGIVYSSFGGACDRADGHAGPHGGDAREADPDGGLPNLDGEDPEALAAYALARVRTLSALPTLPEAERLAACYAAVSFAARILRVLGHVNSATSLDGLADGLYRRIPEADRW